VNLKFLLVFALESELQRISPGYTLVGRFVMPGRGNGGLGKVMNLELCEMNRIRSHFSLFLVPSSDLLESSGTSGLFPHPF